MPTIFYNESEIITIGEALLARTLPKPAWTHPAHFAAAIWLLRRRQDLPARAHMPGIIRAYNEFTGVPNTPTGGYHETITLASLAAASHHIAANPGAPLHQLANTLLAGPCGDKNWLLAFWSPGVLFTPAARAAWAPPDLATLPFPV